MGYNIGTLARNGLNTLNKMESYKDYQQQIPNNSAMFVAYKCPANITIFLLYNLKAVYLQ